MGTVLEASIQLNEEILLLPTAWCRGEKLGILKAGKPDSLPK